LCTTDVFLPILEAYSPYKVIVGRNGSGKSTILKLIARLYDPEEGQILLDGRDIKTLKLEDLRRATAVLFQDYTHFPLSVRHSSLTVGRQKMTVLRLRTI